MKRSPKTSPPVAGLDGFEPQTHRQVRLADTGRTQHDHVVPELDVVAGGQLLHLLLVDRGLVGEVERLQGLHEREAGHCRAHRDVIGGLGGDLFAQHLLQDSA